MKCNTCDIEKLESDFYKKSDGFYKKCKECVKAYNRQQYKENPEYKEKRIKRYKEKLTPQIILKNKERSKNFYKSISGRAKNLLKSAQRRSGKFNEPLDLDENFILEKLEKGYCEVTGLKFDFDSPIDTCKNPYSPSIDRIDPNIGYIKSNVRIVIWQYNLMKGELTDDQLLGLCKLIVERNNCE